MPRPKRKPISKPKADYSQELRIIVPVVLFFLAIGALGYWASRRQAKTQKRHPLRIVGLSWVVESPAFAGAKRRFEYVFPDSVLEVSGVDGPALVDKLAAKQPPDLVLGVTRDQAAALAGRVVRWNDFFDSRTRRADFLSPFLNDGVFSRAEVLMMPVMGDGAFLLTRPRWLADANVSPPFETWTQLAVAATKLTQGKGESTSRYGMAVDWGEGNAALIFASAMQARGAAVDPLARSLAGGDALDALRFWGDLVSGGLCSKDTFAAPKAARQAFLDGRAAMVWTVASTREQAAARLGADQIACVALPGSETHGTAVVTYGAVVPTTSKQRDLAERFVREDLLAETFQRNLAESAMRLPTLRRNYQNLKGGEWQMILRVLDRGAAAKPPNFDRLDRVLVKDLTPAITASQQPKDALAQAAKDLAPGRRATP
jgi:ABC-type glycerol-3-phosphate transport system substrate-binding protein